MSVFFGETTTDDIVSAFTGVVARLQKHAETHENLSDHHYSKARYSATEAQKARAVAEKIAGIIS